METAQTEKTAESNAEAGRKACKDDGEGRSDITQE